MKLLSQKNKMDSKNKAKKILNLGCGEETYGTHRIDFVKTKSATDIADLNGKLPYPSNFFDEVYSKSVIEHILNLKTFVSEIHRVLKKGGRVFILTDNAAYLPFHLFSSHEHNKIIEGGRSYSFMSNNDAHYHLFVESHLRKLFKEFRDIEVKYSHGGSTSFNRFLLSLLPKRLGKFHIKLYARK
jgi:SAM-dependent methyltransferase